MGVEKEKQGLGIEKQGLGDQKQILEGVEEGGQELAVVERQGLGSWTDSEVSLVTETQIVDSRDD